MTILAEPLAVPIPVDHESTVDGGPLRPGDPTAVGDWRLVSRLGRGGMADVFYAIAPGGRSAAVKILRAGPHAPHTCRREYHLASTVDAGCTAPPLGYGMSPAGPYLVTTHLPGYRSAATLDVRSPPAVWLWAFGLEVARILSSVHASGIVHCDVKPSNLLIQSGDVRLIDFGISHYVGEYFGADGAVKCTRGWAAPEQLRVTAATPAVDIFGWGCLLAYLAGGVHPFASNNDDEWIMRIRSAEPDLFGVPADLAEVVRWTLVRDPTSRPTASDLADICAAQLSPRLDGLPPQEFPPAEVLPARHMSPRPLLIFVDGHPDVVGCGRQARSD
jgi:serine/threonine protein kinase